MATESKQQTEADKKATTAKEVAQTTPEQTPKVTTSDGPVEARVALNRINGTIEPGTMFRPADAQELSDLDALNAVRPLTEAEQALFDKLEADATPTSDVLG